MLTHEPYIEIQKNSHIERFKFNDLLKLESIQQARTLNSRCYGSLLSFVQFPGNNNRTAWAFYDKFFLEVCLPYTQLVDIFAKLEDSKQIILVDLPQPFENLICRWAQLRKIDCLVNRSSNVRIRLNRFFKKIKQIFVDFLLSAYSLASVIWLLIAKNSNNIGIWSGDFIGASVDYDTRLGDFYPLLRENNKPFIEFIRTVDIGLIKIFQNMIRRKRAVIYYWNIVNITTYISKYFLFKLKSNKNVIQTTNFTDDVLINSLANYIPSAYALEFQANVFKHLLKILRIRVFMPWFFSSRTASLVFAAKDGGIRTIGIMHGMSIFGSMGHELMPEYSGNPLGPDVYGVWSEWWLDYFKKHSSIYAKNALKISGPLRPIAHKKVTGKKPKESELINVLIISEPNLAPDEMIPYILELLEHSNIYLQIKVRPMGNDKYLERLNSDYPDIMHKITTNRDRIEDAIVKADVVIGSYSTAVMEAAALDCTFILVNTRKWGDYYQMASIESPYSVFVTTPNELYNAIITATGESHTAFLSNMANQYLGLDKNGAEWLAAQCSSGSKL